jgi:hypothetical protein
MIGILGFDSPRGLGIFLFSTASKTALGPTQPPIQWVGGALTLGVKRPGREADHPPPSSAEVKEWVELYLHSLSTPSWRGAQLKAQGQLYLSLLPLPQHQTASQLRRPRLQSPPWEPQTSHTNHIALLRQYLSHDFVESNFCSVRFSVLMS